MEIHSMVSAHACLQRTARLMLSLRNLSLRRKLPLLVSCLTAGALLIAGGLAYLEVRRSALAAAESRLESIVSELGTITAVGQATRIALEQRVAGSSEVRAALRGSTFDTLALSRTLDGLRSETDLGMPVSIVRLDGSVAFRSGSFVGTSDPDSIAPFRDERAYGPLRSVGGRTVYWVTVPIVDTPDATVGWIAQRRGLGQPQAASTLGLLLGGGIRLLLGTAEDSVWADVTRGAVVVSTEIVPVGETYRFHTPEGAETLAFAGTVPQAPWIVQADRPMRDVMARARTFLWRALGLGSLLTMLAVFVAWLTSGRLVRPLEDLVAATDAMAGGDYGKRVRTSGVDDELGRLATTFNAMAARVAGSEEALRLQLEEVRGLALRLEEANLVAEHARAEAQTASNVKSDFLASMSHEIRTPIHVIISYVDLMKAGVPDKPTERQLQYLRRIDESWRLLDLLLNDLLTFFRLESGQVHFKMGKGSAAEAIRGAISALEPTAAGKGISLVTRGQADAAFHADAQRVQQIVLNLLSNAIKYTPRGGSVTLSCACTASGPTGAGLAEGPSVRIDVEDTGVGIPEDEVARIFQPFVRGEAEPVAETRGTGLGLAISQRLASMMSGRITVQSADGEGSRFTLWLRSGPSEETPASPLDRAASPEFQRPAQMPTRKQAGSPGRH
jgi:signal transduction histidine kinase